MPHPSPETDLPTVTGPSMCPDPSPIGSENRARNGRLRCREDVKRNQTTFRAAHGGVAHAHIPPDRPKVRISSRDCDLNPDRPALQGLKRPHCQGECISGRCRASWPAINAAKIIRRIFASPSTDWCLCLGQTDPEEGSKRHIYALEALQAAHVACNGV